MRAGACAVQQTLTSEAASVLKHSLSLARRRGHAQLTPLHVAATLLSSRASLLRRACLKSQPHQASHPLQCRALELCFNVALNRLPTSPGPLLHGQPSFSNALIAALKRAQAHQRRGCIEQQQQQQQQPLLAIKVELEQLILSILDDPSVSRVMREAGFSSTAVKNNLEDTSASPVFQCYNSSGGIYSVPSSPPSGETPRDSFINPTSLWHNHFLAYSSEQSPLFFSPQKKVLSQPFADSASLKEDIKVVLEVLLRKKRNNTVIISDSVAITESLVAELMAKVERGDVPQEMKSAQFIKFQFSSVPLKFMKREEVEHNLSDLNRKVHSLASGGGGVIIYTGDLKWAVDTSVGEKEGGLSNSNVSGYSPVDHLVSEIGKLLFDYSGSSTKVWLMATANYQTYMRCQLKQPPLEMQWSLQAVSVPSGGLGLSLNATSVYDSRLAFSHNPSQMIERKLFTSKEEQEVLNCSVECTSNFDKEADLFKANHQKSSSYIKPSNAKDMDKGSAQLPFWLQSHSTEAHQREDLTELKGKCNKLCHSLHQGRQNQNQMNSSVLNNQSLAGKNYTSTAAYPWLYNQSSILPDSNSISFADTPFKPKQTANCLPKFRRQQSCHIEFSFSNGKHKHHQPAEPNLDSLKKSEDKEVKITLALGTSEFSDTRKLAFQPEDLCKLLQENVPWHAGSGTIPSIVEALISSVEEKKDCWILMQGNDSVGKNRLARAIAESLFGSDDLLLCLNAKKSDSKSSEGLETAILDYKNPVVLVENIDSADSKFAGFLAAAMSAKERSSSQTIFVLTKGDETASFVDAKKDVSPVIQMKLQVGEFTMSNLDHKRKAEWDFPNKKKNPKNEKDEADSIEDGNVKKEFTRQPSSNTLDLNVKADDEEYETEAKGRDLDSISSASTNLLVSLEKFENCFVFDQDSATDGQIRELFLSKIKGSFGELFGRENLDSLTVDEMVLEEIKLGSISFLNSLFDKWLKDIFQTSLKSVNFGGKKGIEFRLCLGGKEKSSLEDGFLGSRLPKRIQVSDLD